MIIAFFKWLFKNQGWILDTSLQKNFKKAVLIAAPHTSNWDFVFAMAAFSMMGINVRFTIKKEWIKFPFKSFMESLGAIGIDRSAPKLGHAKRSTVDAMTELFNEHEELVVAVTPEGTRKINKHWKTGFYHVALNANVPILFGYLDYEKKIAGITGYIHPTGDMEADMKVIMDFYKNVKGKFPENFSPDVRYL
jgi:1-acyl-sn-glycerol-3-phosphate acyltransferase